MARRFQGLTRALGGGSIASVAYGEIGSSIFFALGIVAAYAAGLTPWVLLIAGAIFVLVSLSYAEGTAAIPEVGGAALFVRRAFNDPAGFMTGWALFLDYLIVIALAALFVPHYLAAATGWEALRDSPWDVVVGVVIVLGVAGIRVVRRPQMYAIAVGVAVVAVLVHLLLIVLGLPLLFSWDTSRRGSTSARRRTGTSSRSRCRSPCSRTRVSRPSRTSRRRPASRDARFRAASSPASARS